MNERTPIVPSRDFQAVADTRGRPLADLRLSVMDRCNFRCPYCMPRDTYGDSYRFLNSRERLSFDDAPRAMRLLQSGRSVGKVVLELPGDVQMRTRTSPLTTLTS